MSTLSELRPVAIDRMKRRVSIEKCLLAGVTSIQELANRFGVSRSTIVDDIAKVHRQWANWSTKKKYPARLFRVAQLDHIAQLALRSFEESRQDEITITTRLVSDSEPIDEAGELSDLLGVSDENEQKKMVTVTRKKRVGDPAFLNVAAKAIKEASLVEGSCAPKKHEHKGTVNVDITAVSKQMLSEEDIERVLAINDRFMAAMNGQSNTIDGIIAQQE